MTIVHRLMLMVIFPLLLILAEPIIGILFCGSIVSSALCFYFENLSALYFSLFMLLAPLVAMAWFRKKKLRETTKLLINPSKSPVAELAALYETDQNDRKQLGLLSVPPFAYMSYNWLIERDHFRVGRCLSFIAQGKIISPEAHYHAAMILQHGFYPDHFQSAYELAKQASADGEKRGEWLAKAAYDRWSISQGQPQKYGTQFPEILLGPRILRRGLLNEPSPIKK